MDVALFAQMINQGRPEGSNVGGEGRGVGGKGAHVLKILNKQKNKTHKETQKQHVSLVFVKKLANLALVLGF